MKTIKNIFLLLLFAKALAAQDLSGTKIYLNPGHGGYDSNDRNIPETGFWESVSNLDKGLALRKILEGIHATVYMSRTANTSADDLPLSQIVSDCNAKNVDYFHSIHSNAFNAQSNYTLLLFQGKDNAPTYPDALTMGSYITDEIYKANRTTAKYNRGDFDFYGTGQAYLGVFKNLNVPGTLSEGSFHDYFPESWRLMNGSYKKHEAWAIARAFLRYFLNPGFPTGIVAGLVRDPNKTVSYYGIISKNDQKLPLNNIKVTLEPGGKIFYGDANNNGFFMFDSLAPGAYKIYFEAPGYYKDSSSVTVTENTTSFADKFLIYDTTSVAKIINYYPASLTDSVKTIVSISISFDLPMDTASTNAAFQLSPSAVGTFSWGNGNKQITFKPTVPYLKATEYTVTLFKSAKTVWNIPLENDLTFKFVTKNRNRFVLESTYPIANAEIEASIPRLQLQFDMAVQTASLANQINLYDAARIRQTVANVKIFSENGKGLIYFEPKVPLVNGDYLLVIGSKIAGVDSIPMVDSAMVPFKVNALTPTQVALVDDFELQAGWKNPAASQYTSGVDTVTSQFLITTEKKIYGAKSGRLIYFFSNASGGNCVVSNELKLDVQNNYIGGWVFGDLSNNYLSLWYEDGSNTEYKVLYDTLDWAGWKFITVGSSNTEGKIPAKLTGIGLEQNSAGTQKGTLYFDDFQSFTITDVVESNYLHLNEFTLQQNYPNPFNPETMISYRIPENSFVSLKVFDVLGNEVAALVNEFQQPGMYHYKFGISNYKLTSGVYFYQLRAGKFVESRKMLLLK